MRRRRKPSRRMCGLHPCRGWGRGDRPQVLPEYVITPLRRARSQAGLLNPGANRSAKRRKSPDVTPGTQKPGSCFWSQRPAVAEPEPTHARGAGYSCAALGVSPGVAGYFALSEHYNPVPDLDEWMRRRVRTCPAVWGDRGGGGCATRLRTRLRPAGGKRWRRCRKRVGERADATIRKA